MKDCSRGAAESSCHRGHEHLIDWRSRRSRRKALTQRTRRTQRNTTQLPSPFHYRAFTAMKPHALETDFRAAGSPVTRNRHPYLVTRISSLGRMPPALPPLHPLSLRPHHSPNATGIWLRAGFGAILLRTYLSDLIPEAKTAETTCKPTA